jgi:tRNA(Ile)-lysidine synthase
VTPEAAALRFIAACQPDIRLLVAVSGGSDSLGLMLALNHAIHASGRRDIDLHAATIDHALRAQSHDEAQMVADLCKSLSIPHHIRVWSGDKPGSGLPEAARMARYQLLSSIAATIGADLIVTGHTLNDQQETVAMRQMRSDADAAGLSGMAEAMLFNGTIWVVRPFLNVTRQAIRSLLNAQNMRWIDDPTNENPAYERSRTRKSLEPSLHGLADFTALQQERRALADAAAMFLQDHVRLHDGRLAMFEPSPRHDLVVQHHVLCVLAAVMGGRSHLAGREQKQRLEQVLAAKNDTTLTVSRAVISRRKGRIFVARENRDLPVLVLPAGQTAIWDHRFRIRNNGTDPVRVSGGSTLGQVKPDHSRDIPPHIVQRANKSWPHIVPEIASGEEDNRPAGNPCPDSVSIEPYFPLFDQFLPIFDFSLANSVRQMFSCPAFVAPKLHYI